MNRGYFIAFLALIIILGSCSKEESLEEKYIPYDFPESVDDGQISESMFFQVGAFVTKLNETENDGLAMKIQLLENVQTNESDEQLNSMYKEYLYENDIMLEEFYIEAETSVDRELAHHMENYITYSKNHNDYMNDYFLSNNWETFNLANKEAEEAGISLDVLINLMKEYELYPE